MAKTESSVDRIYDQLRQMAENFEFRPEERINESVLSATLGASRTPLREALNRLAAESFLTFNTGRGFFCCALSPSRIMELYEARQAVECEAVRRAVERAADGDIRELRDYFDATEPTYDTSQDITELLVMDEEFHLRLVGLSGNSELMRMLKNINGRIRYVRLVSMKLLRGKHESMVEEGAKLSEHRLIIEAVELRDAKSAIATIRRHIERHREEVTEAVQIAYSQLYMPAD